MSVYIWLSIWKSQNNLVWLLGMPNWYIIVCTNIVRTKIKSKLNILTSKKSTRVLTTNLMLIESMTLSTLASIVLAFLRDLSKPSFFAFCVKPFKISCQDEFDAAMSKKPLLSSPICSMTHFWSLKAWSAHKCFVRGSCSLLFTSLYK